jgi:two-component system phosphate regulon sensor histidine kinase PhoR
VEARTGSRSLEVLRALGSLMDQGLVALDVDGRVIFATTAACQMLGLPDLPAGATLSEIGIDYRITRVVDLARRTGHLEERPVALHERELIVRAVAPPDEIDIDMLLLIRDETRMHLLERIRRDFVSNVSHELRTPVTAVRLMAETLENGGLEDPVAAADFVRRIGLEAAHMAQIVEELLELSTIESGLRPVVQERVAAESVLASVDRLLPLAESKGVEVHATVEPGTPDIYGDPARLGQVVRNLVHNAIKFTPRGGRIDVTATPGAAGRVLLRCADNGIGIAPSDVPRIFERFWKADSSRQRDGEGSGLGLAIVRHVVEAHGGTVAVVSEPRRGTAFTVDLPAAPNAS